MQKTCELKREHSFLDKTEQCMTSPNQGLVQKFDKYS